MTQNYQILQTLARYDTRVTLLRVFIITHVWRHGVLWCHTYMDLSRNGQESFNTLLSAYPDRDPDHLRRCYTIRIARAEFADCPVHGPIVKCGMSLECNRWKLVEKELHLVLFSSRFYRTGCAITQSERSKHLQRPSHYTTTNAWRVAVYQCT